MSKPVLMLSVAVCALSTPAWAQDKTAAEAQRPTTGCGAPAEATDKPPAQDIVVVGSNIRGSDVTAALPVTVIDATAIAATGALSGDELFRSIPQMGDISFNSAYLPNSSNSARGDVGSVNLRNLGVGNTLVLLNGRRVVTHPTSRADDNLAPVLTYNTNAIPVFGIERLEVLRDGAAAIYGSDAVAGVVNTVLKGSSAASRSKVRSVSPRIRTCSSITSTSSPARISAAGAATSRSMAAWTSVPRCAPRTTAIRAART